MSENDTSAESEAPQGDDYVSDRDFADFPIREETLRGILDMGFKTATPVQAASIEPALAGRHMIVRAKTGTGKTAAFCVPMVDLAEDGLRKPFALVLEPTRELAQQTAAQMSDIAKFRDLAVATLVGGVAMGPQEKALEDGAELIVGTPGRILDHIKRGNLDASQISVVCLDEADEMLSMGFYEDVTAIINKTDPDRQVLLFSATISPDTQRIVQKYQDDPVDLKLSTDTDGVELLDHVLYESSPDMHRVRALLYLLDIEDPNSAIIFCNTREDTATVATFLSRQGLDAELISGELSQARRTAVMQRVKNGEVTFLVATDVAARGIDISDLSHVINYHLPADAAVYLHRTGRTGRIGKKGTAISLVGGTDLATRKTLETKHAIAFDVRVLPDASEAVKMRVERQARQIQDALGTMVFESYLPTVDALLERKDGKMLLAAALRGFFTWDRERRVAASGESTIDALIEQRAEKQARKDERDSGGRGRGRGRDRDGGRDRDRDGGRGRKRDRDDRDDRRERKPKKAVTVDADELDALLDVADEAPKKKRRRRRKKSSDGDDGGSTAAASDDKGKGDDKPKAKKADKPSKPPKIDDLDALLDVG